MKNESERFTIKLELIIQDVLNDVQRTVDYGGQHAEPDQPNAHFTPNDDVDPLQGVQCSFGGDQLTRVRAAGAADLKAGNGNTAGRFEHLKPFICEKFHTRASFVQVSSIYFVVHLLWDCQNF